MDTCQWADCGIRIERNRRGRPRKYCDDHATVSTAARKKAWIPKPGQMPQCCRDWQASAPGRRVCPQHRQWRQFCNDTGRVSWRPDEFVSLLETYGCDVESRNFRTATNPDSFDARTPTLAFDRESRTKIGTDKTMERIADELLTRN